MMNRYAKSAYFDAVMKKHVRRGMKKPPRLPRVLYPERIEEQYLSEIRNILKFTREKLEEHVVPLFSDLVKHYHKDDADMDDLADELETVRIEVEQEYTPDEIRALCLRTGMSVDEWNAKQMNGQFKQLVDIDLFGNGGEPWLKRDMGAFVVQNVQLIESIPDQYLNQVTSAIGTALRQGTRVEDLIDIISDRYDVSDSRAELIARDQIGKFNGQLNRARQKDLGVEKYTWNDSEDARVRPEHHLLNGTEHSWDDPPEPGHPGEDYQCRCWAAPSLDKWFDDTDTEEE